MVSFFDKIISALRSDRSPGIAIHILINEELSFADLPLPQGITAV